MRQKKNEVKFGPPNKELGYRSLVFQGGLPVVPPVPRTVQDPGDEYRHQTFFG